MLYWCGWEDWMKKMKKLDGEDPEDGETWNGIQNLSQKMMDAHGDQCPSDFEIKGQLTFESRYYDAELKAREALSAVE